MSRIRKISKIVTGRAAVDGAGVKLVRVLGHRDVEDFDPFLLLDAFDSTDPEDYVKGFPWHPHRGIETVTYLVSGIIEHGDSLGNKGEILDGDCQWMTAGSGIIHQEMPKPAERMLGVQLWLNLPAKDKMTDPRYGDIRSENVPIVTEEGARIKVIAGSYKESTGAFEGRYVKATYLDVLLDAGKEWSYKSEDGSTLFIYILLGSGSFDPGQPEVIENKRAVLFGEGEQFWIKAGTEGIRFLLLSGKPLKEPIAWGGPIVMNTNEELELAFRELREDSFVKSDGG
ncbi:pirin family protein [Mesotoga sp. BH458_6_3_2_1]|uniref:pirin family protein n=1 Tax=Mesotoga sp. BH458_6_3_2_1 TaxID=1437446 RepID=UPI000EF197FD|nr:pirin family protein [Mesotoga sp. BH458_6_3_2_1]RLL83024.1 pirin [Mesotoga sp. BH458_6_3_2_1]